MPPRLSRASCLSLLQFLSVAQELQERKACDSQETKAREQYRESIT